MIKRLYRWASSMKVGLALLLAIGAVSAAGTVFLPEDFYQTIYFRALLVLLLLNMTLCTVTQLAQILRARTVRKLTLRKVTLFILHLGVVLILTGGIVQSLYGEKTLIAVPQGQAAKVALSNGFSSTYNLYLDDFSIEYYPDGSASQYHCNVRIAEGQGQIRSEEIQINHPLKYGGTKLYLLRYGYTVSINAQVNQDEENAKVLRDGESYELPGTGKTINFIKYIPNYDVRYGKNTKTLRPDNPRILYEITENGKASGTAAAVLNEKIEIAPGTWITFQDLNPFAVFIVKSDPGLGVTAAGGVMLMVGVCMLLFFLDPNKRKPDRQEVSN